ncbi:MAG TPA: hypothetical protein VFG21_11275 [Xanthomonadaceae bacterium]|nr:hypothetical protein [Xanthomonadaceae bacterium]
MTSKLKNNLTALVVVAAFLGAGTLLGEPLPTAEANGLAGLSDQCPEPARESGLPGVVSLPLKLQLTMPYLSLSRVSRRQES